MARTRRSLLRLGAALTVLLALPLRAGEGLTDLEGQPRRLDDYLGGGRWTVVMFWASNCAVCNQEVPAWSLFDERHRQGRVRVLGVSLDGRARLAQAKAFVDRHLVDFPNLVGEPDVVARLFSERGRQPWLGTPSFLLYGPDGQLRARHIGALPPEKVEEFIARQAGG
jgi:peroxiredoxin